jgi:hypothetical protein
MRWRKAFISIIAIAIGVLIGGILTSVANSIPPAGQPGSTDDPLVTKSYVDEQIQNALSGGVVGSSSPSSANAATPPYTIIRLPAGHTLIGSANTKIIVRTGKAIVYSNVAENGITDATDGVDLKNGVPAPNNHLLIIPREGRGVRVDAGYKEAVNITVEGDFKQLDAQGKQVAR